VSTDADDSTRQHARLTAAELAGLVGDTVERVEELTTRGVLAPDHEGRYGPGDAHRIRVVDGFEAAGVPLEVLVRAQEAGIISVAYYDELHAPPGPRSARSYEEFQGSLGTRGNLLPAMFGAFGIAEPEPTTHVSLGDEAVVEELATLVEATGQVDLGLRVLRQFGEATRRASAASLEVYAEFTERMGPDFAGVPSREVYEREFQPWAQLARTLPALAEWLTRHHISRSIDDYSIQATEGVLERSGYVQQRPDVEPAVGFLDLTGFASLTQEHGDTRAAEVALRLAELASRIATERGGRVVKLLGDGVLMRFQGVVEAVEASLELLDQLGPADLPPGHIGVTQGPIIARDGDIFGRTVNLAARISDIAPSGELYVPASTGEALAGRFIVESVGPSTLAGIGVVELARVVRPARSERA
jgi:adenylate cyclase